MKSGRWIMGVMATLMSIVGCKPGLISSGPFPALEPGHPGGLRYFLGKDQVIVEADVTEFVENKLIEVNKRLEEEFSAGIFAVKAAVSLKTVADPENVYLLDIVPRGLKDHSLTVQIGENGLLTSVNVESKDRTGEALLQIGKAVGAIAGTVIGLRAVPADFGKEIVDMMLLSETTPGVKAIRADKDKTRMGERIESLPPEAFFYLQESKGGRALWAEVDRLEQDVIARKAAFQESLDNAARETHANGISLAENQIKFREDALHFLETRLKAAQDAFEAALDRFVKSRKLGRTTKDRKVIRLFEIKDLPPAGVLMKLQSPDGGIKVAEIPDALKDYQGMLDLFKEAKIILTFDPALDIPADRAGSKGETSAENQGRSARIYYREPIPGLLRIFSPTTSPNQNRKDFIEVFSKTEERPVAVLHPGTPVRSVGYESKAFSSQNIRLTIDAHGRIIGLTKAASSSAAGAATGVAGALAGLRDATAETLEKIKAIDQTRREMAAAALQSRIDELDKQAQLIDKRIALKGAAAGEDLALEKKVIDQQLGYLKSQAALAAQLDSAEAALQTAKVGAEVEALRQQVELLKLQIEKLKQEAELAKIRDKKLP
jgi:hypothetical protein